MAAPKTNSAVIVTRAGSTIALPPSTLGFASLVRPDTYDPDDPKVKANFHFTPEGIAALTETIRDKVYTEAALKNIAKEASEAGITKLPSPMSPEQWLELKLKEPKEQATIQLPHLSLANRAFIKKDNQLVPREVGCWDGRNRKLNLAKLRLGATSIVQAVVYPNLYYSKLVGAVQPSLKLVGVRVLKLVQWGGGKGMAPGEASEEELQKVLGADFRADDSLAKYAQVDDDEEDIDAEEDQEAAAPPADKAKRLF